MITTHRLSEEAFKALASGGGDVAVIQDLCAAQHSKQVMLLHAVDAAARETGPGSLEVAAFQAAYGLLATIQATDPGVVAWLLGLPHFSAWAHDCLLHLDRGEVPDFGYLVTAAVSAAVRSGAQFEIDVPARDGQVLLPGLGRLSVPGRDPWLRVRGDGQQLRAGALSDVPYAVLAPDDGSAEPVSYWRGTVLVRAMAEAQTWNVLLETSDRYLDRYALPMSADLRAEEAAAWRRDIQSAWELLVRHHGWASGPVREGVSVIVPLVPRSDNDLDSATTPSAFGAIAASLPPSPVIMAEMLVHEFQHLKLCALMDMVPLIEHRDEDERVYAAWRPDPRPAGGLLQGVYAHVGVAWFWNAQRRVETEPDGILRAQVMYERWRRTIEPSTSTLLQAGCLTEAGSLFLGMLRDHERTLRPEPMPAEAMDIAGEVALDHALTWQLRHTAIDAAGLAGLTAAYRRGAPLRMLPGTRIEADTRKADPAVRGRLLSMRYLDPARFRELCAAGVPGLSDADALLIQGKPAEAAREYRETIVAATDAQPDAWIGLALAISRLAEAPAFTARLPFLFDMHSQLRDQGMDADPLDLAAWFA